MEMTKSGVLLSILAGIKISTDDLKKYGFDVKQISSVCFLGDYFIISLSGKIIPVKQKVRVPFLGVNSDYFDQYLGILKKNDIDYQLFKKPYKYVILNEAKFAIRNDCSYADSLKLSKKPLGLECLVIP